MRITEALAKRLLAEAGIRTPENAVAASEAQAAAAFDALRSSSAVVKAHVPAGGRGKAGLVRSVSSAAAAKEAAAAMLGRTHDGHPVREVLVEESVEHDVEIYVGVTVDPRVGGPALLIAAEGGVEVESLARSRIHMHRFAPGGSLPVESARQLAREAGLRPLLAEAVAPVAAALTRLFTDLEARMVEVNPLGVSAEGLALALDAKLDLDEDAAFRRALQVEPDYASDIERRAAELGLTFVPLDGEVALFGMGAGLTLTGLDLVAMSGSSAASFSELRGGLGTEQVRANFEVILDFADSREEVKAILLLASLVGTPLSAFVTGVADALRGRSSRPPVRMVAAVHATGAALYTMSLDEARAALAEVDVEWYEDVREAARRAAEVPARAPAGV